MKLKEIITGTCTAVLVILGLGVVFHSNPSEAAGYDTLAEFSFDKADGLETCKNLWDTYGVDKAYKGLPATSGIFKDSSRLYSCVSLVDGISTYKKLGWGDSEEGYVSNGNTLDSVPLLEAEGPEDLTDPTDTGKPWGGTPYLQFDVKTTGYDGIRLSLKLGGSKKGPKDFKLQYSIDDGVTFKDVVDTDISITDTKFLYDFSFTALPDEINDKSSICLRIIVNSGATISGGLLTNDPTGGSLAINDVIISGKIAGSVVGTDSPATASPAPTPVPSGCFAAFRFNRPQPSEGAVPDATLDDSFNVNGATDGYKATDGTLSSSAVMYASLNGTLYSQLAWSSESNIYTYNKANLPVIPVMNASPTSSWGKSPYFLFKLSTNDCDYIRMSFKIGGTKKGPKNYKLQYSLDNNTYTDIGNTTVVLDNNKKLYFNSANLPTAISNKETAYIKLIAANEIAIDESVGNFTGLTGGEAAINDVMFEKVSKDDYEATPKPADTPEPTKPPVTQAPEDTQKPYNTKAPDSHSPTPPTSTPDVVPTFQPTDQPVVPTPYVPTPKPQVTATNIPAATRQPSLDNTDSSVKLTKPAAPKLTVYKRGTKVVKGKAVKKASIILKVGSKKYTAKTNTKGKFTIKLKTKLKKGNKLKVYVVKNGTQSISKVYKVK